MPLKIESGTYTVNPGGSKKGPSKFFIWKHWRCRYNHFIRLFHESNVNFSVLITCEFYSYNRPPVASINIIILIINY